MGNKKTIDKFCGKDPFKQVVHDEVYPTLHFEGCGLLQEQCTLYPACYDLAANKFSKRNCNDKIDNYNLFEAKRGDWTFQQTSCITYFTSAFIANYEYQG